MREANKNIVTTSNLSIGYPNLQVAKNINLTINKGNIISVLGLNGSGKSTLIRTLARIQEPLEGEIFLFNNVLDKYGQNELAKKLAIVLTDKLPENLLTVNELIAMGRQAYTNWFDKLTKIDKEKIDFAIESTHIAHLLHKKYSELSDGQKQKVLLAKAIAQDTPIILLDEPTAHLDMHHKMETFLLLQNLAYKHQKSIIMATHEVGLSTQMADELWLLHDATISVGNPKELIKNKLLSSVFDSDLIQFNPKTSTFDYK